jgi:hypothetical protein
MMKRLQRLHPLVGSVVAMAACSSPKQEVMVPPDMTFTTDAFTQALAQAECAGVAARCGIPVDACVTKRTAYWYAEVQKRAPRQFTPARAQLCIDAWKAAYSDGVLTPQEIDPSVTGSAADLCERVFQGAVQDKQPCMVDYDCANSSSICHAVGAVGANPNLLCAPKTVKKLGDGCANPGEVCDTGSYCGSQNGLPTCIARQTKGNACGDTVLCLETLRCKANACDDRLGSGQPCATPDDCLPDVPLCLDVSGTLRCLASLTFGTASPACQPYGL